MNIHKNIKSKLDYFISQNKIPHIVFHGPSGAGKRSVLEYFINKIYSSKENIKKYVMYINCAHGKGIRFIRDELKFFAKTNIQNKNGSIFKSIVLFNADKLTTDAQSALRRCIEQFSHTTRFFIIIDEYRKLLKPIISRFCNIQVSLPIINKNKISLHDYNKSAINNIFKLENKKTSTWLTKNLENTSKLNSIKEIFNFSDKIYQKGYSSLDIMNYISNSKKIDGLEKYKLLIFFDKARIEFRNEKLLIFYILTIVLLRIKCDLENICEM
jgi:DNA polymerase III delta prime subunit